MSERRRQRCVSCRPSEWKAIQAKARGAGMDGSAWIRFRVLDCESPDGPPHPEAGYPMVLSGEEQRRQFELVERLAEDNRQFLDEPVIPGTGATLREAMTFVMLSSFPEKAGADTPLPGPSRHSPQSDAPDPVEEIATALNRESGP